LANRSRRNDSDVLPAITLDVEPTDAGLRQMSEELAEFARDYELSEPVVSKLVAVAGDVTAAVTRDVAAPPLARLTVDADIGPSDTQLVVIAADPRLPAAYASLRPSLDRAKAQCDGFAAELGRDAELQVWARFRLGA
jgi:hypothetical protein